MDRVAIVGSSGSGKSTLARQLVADHDLVHVELDAIMHQPGWTPRPKEEFLVDLGDQLDRAERWVTCGNYQSMSDSLHLERADTIVWLDPVRSVVMWRVTTRTIRRAVRREELWNGNREPLTNLYRWDPELNVIRWSWTHFHEIRRRYEQAIAGGEWDHATVHRLRTNTECNEFVAAARGGATP